MIHIYGLIDPRTYEITYVGQSIHFQQRLKEHIYDDDGGTAKAQWIAELKTAGLRPQIVILDTAETKDEAHYKENWWIVFARHQKWRSVNGTHPGEWRADFRQLFTEHLRHEYEAFVNAVQEQRPLILITQNHFVVFVSIFKAMLALAIGSTIGYGMWLIEYTASSSDVMAIWQGGIAAISCMLMSTLVLFGLAKQHKFEMIYVAVMLFTSLYATFGG